MLATPLDHAGVKVDTQIALGLSLLLDKLTSEPSTSASKIQNITIGTLASGRTNWFTIGVVEGGGIHGPYEDAHMLGREGQVHESIKASTECARQESLLPLEP